jgi:signal transduction histidine kinase
MPSPRAPRYLAAVWLVLLGCYALAAVWLPPGARLTAFSDVFLSLVPLLVNGALLANAVTPDWRKNAFWMLLALGSTLWLAGQCAVTYIEVYQHRPVPDVFLGDIVFFLHTVPMIAALTLQPHRNRDRRRMLYGFLDSSLLLFWWVYLYLFLVIPWQYVQFNRAQYDRSYNIIYALETLVFVAGAGSLALEAKGRWRRIYAHLCGVGAANLAGSLLIDELVNRGLYATGSLAGLPILASLLWLGTTGVVAYRSRSEQDAAEAKSTLSEGRIETIWAPRLARAGLLSLPLIGLWCVMFSRAPEPVHQFRILLTLGAVLPLGLLVFLRLEFVDADRLRLLRASRESLDNLKRLQMQFVQSEKLASLGLLVAGAAHEINNPLTAILGYSDLLVEDPSIEERPHHLAEKIREQARRTKTLVTNLLSFARQVPREQRSLLDINAIVSSSLQLRRLELRGKNIRVELRTGVGLPAVRGDANQLLQVFFNVINNAVDAMEEVGSGTLIVRTLCERGDVLILFSDTGPGMREPRLVFDPFYTTKPVGKGTGLGLSICYGLVQDHEGQITCYNRPEGGATFRIALPGVPLATPLRAPAPPPRSAETKPV